MAAPQDKRRAGVVAREQVAHELHQVGLPERLPDPAGREAIVRGRARIRRPDELRGMQRRPDEPVGAEAAEGALDGQDRHRRGGRVGALLAKALDQRHGHVKERARVGKDVGDRVHTHVQHKRVVLVVHMARM